MSVRSRLVDAGLHLLESEGEAGFSTRAVCALAGVTAPTLYHHFASADGLLNAVVEEAFNQYLRRKIALPTASQPVQAVIDGWNDYVAFARERPRLYVAMTVRRLQGARIAAADRSRELLREKLAALDGDGGLNCALAQAADIVWASAHAAAMLIVAHPSDPPHADLLNAIRSAALNAIHTPRIKGDAP